MTSSQHSRGRTLFEVLCIWGLGGSLAAAWLQTGGTAQLAAAACAALLGLSWCAGLFARRPAESVSEHTFAPMVVAAEPAARTFDSADVADEPPPRIEIFSFEPDQAAEPPETVAPEPVADPKPKRRRKARPADTSEEPVVDQPIAAPVAFEEPVHEVHIEPLFEPQPFARQPRPAFGRKSRALPAG